MKDETEHPLVRLQKVLDDVIPTSAPPILLGISACCFYIHDGYLYYNTDNSLKDLYYENGNTFGGYLPEGYVRNEDMVVANIDTQTGTWMTECFFAKNEVKYEDLEEMFEED